MLAVSRVIKVSYLMVPAALPEGFLNRSSLMPLLKRYELKVISLVLPSGIFQQDARNEVVRIHPDRY